jgi:hypothetical protein
MARFYARQLKKHNGVRSHKHRACAFAGKNLRKTVVRRQERIAMGTARRKMYDCARTAARRNCQLVHLDCAPACNEPTTASDSQRRPRGRPCKCRVLYFLSAWMQFVPVHSDSAVRTAGNWHQLTRNPCFQLRCILRQNELESALGSAFVRRQTLGYVPATCVCIIAPRAN